MKTTLKTGTLIIGLGAAALLAPEIRAAAAAASGGRSNAGGGASAPATGRTALPVAAADRGASNRADAASGDRGNSAAAKAAAPGQEVAAKKRSPVATAALEKVATLHAINAAAFDARRDLLKDVRGRIGDDNEALKAIEETAKAQRQEAQKEFQAKVDAWKASRKALNASLADAEKSDAAHWPTARAALAHDFEGYANATDVIEKATP